MRVLIIGRAKEISAEAAMYRTLKRLGHTVVLLDDRKLRQLVGRKAGSEYIRVRARSFRPDRIIMAKPHDVTMTALEDICSRAPAVMWYRDLTVPPDPELIARAPFFETVFLTAGGQAGEWEAAGARRALFLPDCADPLYETPMPPVREWDTDVAFIGRGTGHDERRIELLSRIAARYHLRVWGQAWDAHASAFHWDGSTAYGADFGRVCASARIVLGANVLPHNGAPIHSYQSNRMVKVLAAEGFFLGHAAPGLRELFQDDLHCAWYDDANHAMNQIERYLADETARTRIRREGRAFLLAHHTFENRLFNLLTGVAWVNPLAAPGTVQRLESAA
jgi:NAD(P)-dependent dehydrogenase (short-subunit alcohol dehydrogenase family)